MRLIKTVCLFIICFLVVSCKNVVMYRSYHHMPSAGWSKGDTLLFDLSVNDSITNDSTPGHYNMELLVRNRTDYRYQHLSLFVQHNFPDTTVWKTDTMRFVIADKNGQWQGKGISGLYELSKPLAEADLSRPHHFTLKVVSLMNDSILLGLNDIGVIAYK